VEFRILGPLEVLENGSPFPITGAKQRALLAVLLLEANRVVSADRVIDELWGEETPDDGRNALQVRSPSFGRRSQPQLSALVPRATSSRSHRASSTLRVLRGCLRMPAGAGGGRHGNGRHASSPGTRTLARPPARRRLSPRSCGRGGQAARRAASHRSGGEGRLRSRAWKAPASSSRAAHRTRPHCEACHKPRRAR
jgi:hypothetical protein